MKSQELPFLGTDEQIFREFKTFDNIFRIQNEIETDLIQFAKEEQEKIENEATE